MSAAGLRAHAPFLAIVVLACAGRLYFAFHWPVVQVSDYAAYFDEARTLAGLSSGGFTSLNAWGPKLLYSVPMRLVGDGVRVIGIFNALLYSAAMVALYLGAQRLFGRATATVTAAVGLVSLSEVYFNNLACTEVPTTLLIATLFALLVGPPTLARTLLLGVVCGLGIYLRSNLLVFPPMFFVADLLLGRPIRSSIRRTIGIQVVALVVTLPLCFLNLRHFGRFTPVISNAAQLWYGNNPRLSGDMHSYPPTPEDFPVGSEERRKLTEEYRPFYANPDPTMEFSKMDVYAVSDVRARYGYEWIRHNPWRYLDLLRARVVLLYWSCTYGEVPYRMYDATKPEQPRWLNADRRLIDEARLPVRSWYRVLIALAVAGLLLTAWNAGHRFWRSPVLVPLLIVAYYSLPFVLTLAANRYHIPVLGLCWIYLANGLVLAARPLFRWRLAPTSAAPSGAAPSSS